MKKVIFILLAFVYLTSCSNKSLSHSETSVSSIVTSSSKAEASSIASVPNSSASGSSIAIDEVFVVSTAVIENGEHASSATINIYSDNTVEVLNFNYDGRAPDVYIAVGIKSEDGSFERVALISNKIEGVQQDATLNLTLNNVGDFNAVSIYCEQYSDDFGSSLLNDVL